MKKNWQIINLTIPTIIAMSSTTIMGIVNLIFIGNLGFEAIGAVGITNVIILNLFSVFGGIGYAVNFLVAQQFGAKNYLKCINFAYTGIYLSLFISIPLIFISIIAPEYIFKLIGASDKVIYYGVGYFRLRIFAFCFTMFRTVIVGFVRAIGDTKSSMYSGLVGNLLNIILSYILIFGYLGFPELGIIGAGWAFFIAELVQTLYMVIRFYLIKEFPTKRIMPIKQGSYKLVSVESVKIGLEDIGMTAAMIFFTAFAARLGDAELAATEIALNVLALAYLPGIGFGITATIMIGQKLGEGNHHKARSLGIQIIKVGSLFLIPLGIVYYLTAENIAKLFTENEQVIDNTVLILTFASVFLIFDGLQLILSGALRGLGENTYLMKTSLLLGLIGFVPLTYLLTFTFSMGLFGMWLSFYIYILGLFSAYLIRYLKINWEKVEIIG